MIQIDERLCTGCGTCLDTCPREAISLQNGVATLTIERCNDCGNCVDVCPQGAILLVETIQPTTEMVKQPTSRTSVATIRPPNSLATPRTVSLWPLMGSFLRWAGTALAPRLANVALEILDRRTVGSRLSRPQDLGTELASRGWRHRHRKRGPR